MKSISVRSVLILLSVFLLPSPGAAQVRITPRGGVFSSPSEFGIVDTDWGKWRVGEREPTWAYGLTLALESNRRVGFRLSGLIGSRSEVRMRNLREDSGGLPTIRTTVQAVSGEVSFDLLQDVHSLNPYLFIGGGMIRNEFHFREGFQVDAYFSESPRSSGVLGAGIDKTVGKWAVSFEVTDYISQSKFIDGSVQHDVFFSLGIGRGFPGSES